MDSPMWVAFQITLVGMGLVFAAILLLWGVMAALVRLVPERESQPEVAGPEEVELKPLDDGAAAEYELKRQAASIAVAFALAAEGEGKVHEFPIPPTPIVSAWQAVLRTNMLNKRGSVR